MTAARPAQAVDAPTWLVDFYRTVDALDVEAIVACFAPDGVMIFGSAEPMVGHDGLRAGVTWIASTYRRMSHEFVNVWVCGDTVLLEATVTYECLDGRAIPIPTVTILERRAGAIVNLRIFSDPSALQAG